MATAGTRCIRLAATLAVVLMISPQVVAATGLEELVGRADLMQHRGAFQERGDLALYQTAADEAAQAPALELQAASGYGWYFEVDTLRVAGLDLNTPAAEPTAIGSPSQPLEDVNIHTIGASPRFDLRVLAAEEGSASFHALLRGSTDLWSLPSAQITHYGGIEEHRGNVQDSPTDDDQQSFVHRVVDEPVVLTQALGGIVDLQVEGDFILEFYGVDVVLETGDGTKRSISTSHTTDGGNDTAAATESWRIFRIIVEDATLSFQHTDLGRLVRWASFDADVRGDDGVVQFEGLRDPRGGLPDAQAVRFSNGYAGTLAPGGDHLAVELAESPGPPLPPASAWLSPAGFNPLPIAAVLVAVALASMVFRTARRTPQLALMEDALEAGSFGRAARVAGRILRTDPTRESAHLGRAIAMSRTGRPERVVRELKRYLRDNEPSDGTLHYVLGLAYRDLGKEAAAAEALSEAVQRTPALAQQVPDVPAPPRRNQAEGDAQGYT